jgi:hypothetical protein
MYLIYDNRAYSLFDIAIFACQCGQRRNKLDSIRFYWHFTCHQIRQEIKIARVQHILFYYLRHTQLCL